MRAGTPSTESLGACRIGASLFPVCSTVCGMLPEGRRKTTHNVFCVNDLTKLPAHTVAQMQDWLAERVEIYASKTGSLETERDRFTIADDCKELHVAKRYLESLQLADQIQVCLSMCNITSAHECTCLCVLQVRHKCAFAGG